MLGKQGHPVATQVAGWHLFPPDHCIFPIFTFHIDQIYILWHNLSSLIIPPLPDFMVCCFPLLQWPLMIPGVACCVALLSPGGERSKLFKPAPHTAAYSALCYCAHTQTMSTQFAFISKTMIVVSDTGGMPTSGYSCRRQQTRALPNYCNQIYH